MPLLALLLLAAPTPVASFDDPAGDVIYAPPGDSELSDGDFDLRRFAVLADGDDVVFEVTLGAAVRRPQVTQRSNQSELQLTSGIYSQNIDIYIDTGAPGPGYTACIPGRRVAFDGAWKSAVVLTPQPGPARSITEDALGKEAASHVVFVDHVQSRGRTLIARVPALFLGGPPRKNWGYSVHVSGAEWERSFSAVDRLRGTRELNAFTMPVLPQREAWAFGGASETGSPPRVVDVLLPPGVDQKAVLGSFNPATGAFARVPFVYAERPPATPTPTPTPTPTAPATPTPTPTATPTPTPTPTATATPTPTAIPPPTAPPASASPPRGPELTVQYVAGNMISLTGPAAGLQPMQFGRVLGPQGELVARVVIVQVLETGLVASAVENPERVKRGARVRFDPPSP